MLSLEPCQTQEMGYPRQATPSHGLRVTGRKLTTTLQCMSGSKRQAVSKPNQRSHKSSTAKASRSQVLQDEQEAAPAVEGV